MFHIRTFQNLIFEFEKLELEHPYLIEHSKLP